MSTDRMSWDEYLFGFAQHAAAKSKDSTQVGAALIGPERELRLTGYNGVPMGVLDLPERRSRENGEKYLWASHAEQNVIAFAAREGIRTKGCTLYVTHAPCDSCARSIIQAGICEVVIGDGTTSMPERVFEAAGTMFDEAGVKVRHFIPESYLEA
jgi:dCMP deaminase